MTLLAQWPASSNNTKKESNSTAIKGPPTPPCPRLETSDVRWEYEDDLPEMEDDDFDAIFKASRVRGVRMYPFVEDSNGTRIWITHLPGETNTTTQTPL